MNELKTNELIVLKNNLPTLSEKVDELLVVVNNDLSLAKDNDATLREAILSAMLQNNIDSCKLAHYSLSVVRPHDIFSFDTNSFIENERTDIINAFTEVVEEDDEFNLEKFKEENPEIYQKYLTKKQTINVDCNKLKSVFPDIYNKYMSSVPSTRKVTLAIKKAK